MKTRDFDPLKLDVAAFAKSDDALLEGTWPLAELERLVSSTVVPAEATPVSWRARGELRAVRGGQPQIWLHTEASTRVMLECQRCLMPVAADVTARRSFLFVHGEDTAAELDSDSEDDVLALTRSLDVRELIEDELLLALPIVPRHDVCPVPLPVRPNDPQAEEKPNPFAALAVLKRGGPLN